MMAKYFTLVSAISAFSVQMRGARPEEPSTTTEVYEITQTTTVPTIDSISWILYALVLPICLAFTVLIITFLYRRNQTPKKAEQNVPVDKTNTYSCYPYISVPIVNDTETNNTNDERNQYLDELIIGQQYFIH